MPFERGLPACLQAGPNQLKSMFRKEYRRCYWSSCKAVRLFGRERARHDIHFCLTLLTLGLWSVSWLAATIGAVFSRWECTRCKAKPHTLCPKSAETKPEIVEIFLS